MSSGMEDPYRTLGYALKRAQQALRARLDGTLRTVGLTMPQYSVLAGLEGGAGLSNADLARRAFVTAQTMQAIIAGLERAGLIARTAHPSNGKILVTELTAAGRDVLQGAHRIVADIEATACDAVAPDDPDAIRAVLLRMAAALA